MAEPTLDEQIAAVRGRISNWERFLQDPDPQLDIEDGQRKLETWRAVLATLERHAAGLFVAGEFTAHSGAVLSFKIECDVLTDGDIATLVGVIAKRVGAFGPAIGVPRGGVRIADALASHATSRPTLIVDDVLTTGASMEEARQENPDAIGAVLFARGPCPDWVYPVFVTGDEHEHIKQERDAARAELAQLRQRHERAMVVVDAARAAIACLSDRPQRPWTSEIHKLGDAVRAFDAAERPPFVVDAGETPPLPGKEP